MNLEIIFQFLKKLEANNNREWFKAHHSDYEKAIEEFEQLMTILIARVSFFEPGVSNFEPKDCMYRIYRDLRFTKDKTPYKTHIGGFINPKGRKSLHCGYYVHLEPGACMLAGGGWSPEPAMLKGIRQSIFDNTDEFLSIIKAPSFSKHFQTIGMEHLKTAPKDFPKDYPYMEYLKPKDYVVWKNVPDSFFSTPGFIDQIMEVFEGMKPYNDFLNYTIDEFI